MSPRLDSYTDVCRQAFTAPISNLLTRTVLKNVSVRSVFCSKSGGKRISAHLLEQQTYVAYVRKAEQTEVNTDANPP